MFRFLDWFTDQVAGCFVRIIQIILFLLVMAVLALVVLILYKLIF